MQTKLVQVIQRVQELEQLASEVANLVEKLATGEAVQPELSVKGQRWYRGGRELLANHQFSGLQEFEDCYEGIFVLPNMQRTRAFVSISTIIQERDSTRVNEDHQGVFSEYFQKARSLVLGLEEELLSKELPVVTQLSFEVAASEFDTAEELFKKYGSDEAILRASGIIARVALERHLYTVIQARKLTTILNPPTKKKAGTEDLLNTLQQNGVITAVQRSQLRSLFDVANNCAHPKEVVKPDDVQRLIKESRSAASGIT